MQSTMERPGLAYLLRVCVALVVTSMATGCSVLQGEGADQAELTSSYQGKQLGCVVKWNKSEKPYAWLQGSDAAREHIAANSGKVGDDTAWAEGYLEVPCGPLNVKREDLPGLALEYGVTEEGTTEYPEDMPLFGCTWSGDVQGGMPIANGPNPLGMTRAKGSGYDGYDTGCGFFDRNLNPAAKCTTDKQYIAQQRKKITSRWNGNTCIDGNGKQTDCTCRLLNFNEVALARARSGVLNANNPGFKVLITRAEMWDQHPLPLDGKKACKSVYERAAEPIRINVSTDPANDSFLETRVWQRSGDPRETDRRVFWFGDADGPTAGMEQDITLHYNDLPKLTVTLQSKSGEDYGTCRVAGAVSGGHSGGASVASEAQDLLARAWDMLDKSGDEYRMPKTVSLPCTGKAKHVNVALFLKKRPTDLTLAEAAGCRDEDIRRADSGETTQDERRGERDTSPPVSIQQPRSTSQTELVPVDIHLGFIVNNDSATPKTLFIEAAGDRGQRFSSEVFPAWVDVGNARMFLFRDNGFPLQSSTVKLELDYGDGKRCVTDMLKLGRNQARCVVGSTTKSTIHVMLERSQG